MRVKELIKILTVLEKEAIIDMASDEEGNSFGDISNCLAQGKLLETGELCYSLYPENNQLAEEKFL
jgi:hypothetical protein